MFVVALPMYKAEIGYIHPIKKRFRQVYDKKLLCLTRLCSLESAYNHRCSLRLQAVARRCQTAIPARINAGENASGFAP